MASLTLEERYNQATTNTYVGRVKELQAAGRGPGPGVNFLDGNGRDQWSPGASPAPDEFQTEFTRNAEGAYRYGGAGKVAGSVGLSRWNERAHMIAFEGAGPRSLPAGYWGNNRFTLLSDVRNAGVVLHQYIPLAGKNFTNSLTETSKSKILGSATGPSPAGLNG